VGLLILWGIPTQVIVLDRANPTWSEIRSVGSEDESSSLDDVQDCLPRRARGRGAIGNHPQACRGVSVGYFSIAAVEFPSHACQLPLTEYPVPLVDRRLHDAREAKRMVARKPRWAQGTAEVRTGKYRRRQRTTRSATSAKVAGWEESALATGRVGARPAAWAAGWDRRADDASSRSRC
jgi:hypothetical protein